jgi:hypothetical protein
VKALIPSCGGGAVSRAGFAPLAAWRDALERALPGILTAAA